MLPADDSALLRQYAQSRCDDAFAALVTRHINLVYSVALRHVGNPHHAEEVAQAVFISLAKNAAQLRHEKALSSWLFQATRLTASNFVRSEIRRHRREHEGHVQSVLNESGNDAWPRIAPLLDTAVAALSEKDRRAIVLRFYEGRTLREVGTALSASEDAAEKRVARALEKLRTFFAKRGVTVGASGLAAVLSANAIQAAPVGLAVIISTSTALAGATIAATATATAIKTIAMTTLQKTLITATLVAAVGTGIYEARQASRLREQNQTLGEQQAPLAEQIKQLQGERDDAMRQLAALRGDNERVNRNPAELLRLRGEVTKLRRQQDELLKELAVKITSPLPQQNEVDASWVQQVLNSLPKDQGSAADALRGKMLRREMTNISPSEVALQDALLRRQLNLTLERSPADFADFQTAFIQASLAISDGGRVQQMRDLIQKTYERAVETGLDIPSKPATDTDAWAQRRFQLDREATAQLKQLFTPDERELFDRAFLGVMGVDLGGVGVDKSNYPKGFLGPE